LQSPERKIFSRAMKGWRIVRGSITDKQKLLVMTILTVDRRPVPIHIKCMYKNAYYPVLPAR